MVPRKHFLKKLILDPCPIMEYFVPEGEEEIVHVLLGERGIKWSLDVHTVNREYAQHIANRMRVSYTPAQADIDPSETEHLLSQPISENVAHFLSKRHFTPELCQQFKVTSWKYKQHHYHSWAHYFPFNYPALISASMALDKVGYMTFLPEREYMIVPSYDRQGKLNNLAFRFIDEDIVTWMAKWLFSHGRQATFGLEEVDPSKPVLLVEGFFDRVACKLLSGGKLQAVGLGSAFISDYHWRFLKGLDCRFLLDSDETGRRYSKELKEEGHKVYMLSDEFKDPWEFYENGRDLKFRVG
jgi:DNA primase